MSNENQILVRVQKFMNYHSGISRTLPDTARIEFDLLRDVINAHLAPKPEPEKPKKKVKKKAKKKVKGKVK